MTNIKRLTSDERNRLISDVYGCDLTIKDLNKRKTFIKQPVPMTVSIKKQILDETMDPELKKRYKRIFRKGRVL